MHAAGDLTSQNHPLDFLMSLFFLPRIDWPIAIVAVSKAPPA
jgi:hypothetical protein